jgi:hypothetical protein
MQSADVLTYILNLELGRNIAKLLRVDEMSLLDRVRDTCIAIPKCAGILSTLLTRKWPKWHTISMVSADEILAIDALLSVGLIETIADVVDWECSNLETPRLECDSDDARVLLRGLSISRSRSRLDVLFDSLPISTLRSLYKTNGGSLSKDSLVSHIKTSFNGKQRTIFGEVNDRGKMLRQIEKSVGETVRLVLLSSAVLDLFLRVTFLLDIDTDAESSWNSALPTSILKGEVIPLIDWRPQPLPPHLSIYESRESLEQDRIIHFLEWLVFEKKLSNGVESLASNIRSLLESYVRTSRPEDVPEWIWRRRLPRRLANLLWRCVFELERLKNYELAIVQMEFLLDHHTILLGRKRMGKIAIRLLIGLGHVGEDQSVWLKKIQLLDLFPADRAEIERRSVGDSVTKFIWPCGEIDQREIYIPGCRTRDFNWVEQAAIDQFFTDSEIGPGFEHGLHCEGRIMMHVYEVFMGEILRPLSDQLALFQSPLQKYALDAGYLAKSPERWAEVETLVERIKAVDYDDLASMYMSLVRPSEESDRVISILKCFTGELLGGIIQHIASDPFYWGGGQPDLLLWDTRDRKVLFSEVKGPGDQLAPRQRYWLTALKSLGAEAEVCWVKEGPTKKSRKQKPKILKREIDTKVEIEVIELDDSDD